MINKARDAVKPAIHDLEDRDHRSDIFEALIGDKETHYKFSLSILEHIRDYKNCPGKLPATWKNKPPEFVCVHTDTHDKLQKYADLKALDPWVFCEEKTTAWAFGHQEYRFIFLCRRFWEHDVEPPPRRMLDACPGVTDENEWVDDDAERLVAWQKYLVVHELIHQYISDGGLTRDTNPREVYSLNECTGLDTGGIRERNPNNLEYYVASKCSKFVRGLLWTSLLCKVMEQHCVAAPNMDIPPWPGIRGQQISSLPNTIRNITVGKPTRRKQHYYDEVKGSMWSSWRGNTSTDLPLDDGTLSVA